jgi:hypothetical protein
VALVLAFGMGWLAARSLLKAMYQGRSLPALNTLISGQAEHPLAEYYQALDQWLLLAGLFVVLPLALSLFFWGTSSQATREKTAASLAKCAAGVRTHWQTVYFALAFLVLIFSLGFAARAYEMFPYPVLKRAGAAAQDWAENWRHNLRIRPDKCLKPARYDGSGVTVHVPQAAYQGVTFITSLFDKSLGMILVDMSGSQLHKWRVPFEEIWPQAQDRPHDWDSEIHGAILHPNGDVVFNIEWQTLVKIDRC